MIVHRDGNWAAGLLEGMDVGDLEGSGVVWLDGGIHIRLTLE